jgi:hypothetical protein
MSELRVREIFAGAIEQTFVKADPIGGCADIYPARAILGIEIP